MEKVSVIIPVLRESNFLDSILNRFLKDTYKNKEVLVTIDEPTKSSLHTAKKFGKSVKFILNKKRVGKSRALNKVVQRSKGNILFFFDSDNKIHGNSNNTLKTLVNEMDGKDVAEFRTDTIKDSFMSNMTGFDFINANFVGSIFSKVAKRKPIIGGMAFAMRKNVFSELGGFKNFISEDIDISWRAFKKGKSYVNIDKIRIMTKSPSSLKEWFTQRKRWSVGLSEWFVKDSKTISKTFIKNSGHVTLPSMFIVFPPLVMALVGLILSESILEEAIILSLALLPLKFLNISPLVFIALSSVVLFKSLLMYVISFTASFSSIYAASKFMGYKFSFPNFLVYYFLYSPIMLSMYMYGILSVGLLRNTKLSDWKV